MSEEEGPTVTQHEAVSLNVTNDEVITSYVALPGKVYMQRTMRFFQKTIMEPTEGGADGKCEMMADYEVKEDLEKLKKRVDEVSKEKIDIFIKDHVQL